MKLNLNPPAVTLLTTMLAEPGWSKSDHAPTAITRLYLAGKTLTELPVAPATELELSDKAFKVCQDCTTWFIKEGRCPAGPGMFELITQFDLYKE